MTATPVTRMAERVAEERRRVAGDGRRAAIPSRRAAGLNVAALMALRLRRSNGAAQGAARYDGGGRNGAAGRTAAG